jgi:hypothetical protein
MATLAELRSRLRVLLNDDAAKGYLWSDAVLDLHLNDALRDYGRAIPRQGEIIIAIVAGEGEYDLPADCLAVIRVEVAAAADQGDHRFLLREIGDADGPGYEVYGGRLIIRPTPSEAGASLMVRYLASHAALAVDGDPSTAPAADEDLLLAFACAEALQGLSTEEAKRQRFEDRAGRSAEAAAALCRQQYERGIRARTAVVRAGRLVAAS